MWSLIALSIATSFAIACVAVPLTRALCRSLGIVDKPDQVRKLQTKGVSLGGGVAVFASLCLAFTLIFFGDRHLGDGLLGALGMQWKILFYCGAALVLVGLYDDIFALRGRQKLLAQILIVCAVVGSGTLVRQVHLGTLHLDLGIFAFPLTVLWLLAAVNALNLIDGADGMASTVGAMICGGLAVMCLHTHSDAGAIVAASLCGALLGFLIFNRPPASIYLGDAGSMVIGLFAGVLSIWGSTKGSTLLSFAPMLMLSLPIFDSLIAILRRTLTGRSIYATDRAHLHHRLLDRVSHRTMLVLVASLTAFTCATSVFAVIYQKQTIAIMGVLAVFGFLVFSRLFGNSELRMLAKRTTNFGESLFVRHHNSEFAVHEKKSHLQGTRQWDLLWQSLVEFAIDRDLSLIKLDISIAWMQEGYHGSWQRSRLPEKSEQFSLRLPIFVDGRQVARLELLGDAKRESAINALEQVTDRLADLQSQIRTIIAVSGDGIPAVNDNPADQQTPAEAPENGTISGAGLSYVSTGGTHLPSSASNRSDSSPVSVSANIG